MLAPQPSPPMGSGPALPSPWRPEHSFGDLQDPGAGPKALPSGWESPSPSAVHAGATSGSGRPTPSVVEPPQTGGVPPPFEAGLLGTPASGPGLPPSPPPDIGGIPGSPPRQAGRLSSPTQGEEAWKTYERVTGDKWGGGASPEIQQLLKILGIKAPPGSAQANLALQQALNKGEGRPEMAQLGGNALG